MVAESGTVTYSDTLLESVIARYPLPDIAGEWPTLPSGSVNTDWVATYDLAHAAADVWDEKANTVADYFDFQADGARFDKSQVFDHYAKQARIWRSRRAIGTHTLVQYPPIKRFEDVLVNAAEDD
jgi:hypothetical protein